MIQIVREQFSQGTRLKLLGSIDETSNFDKLIGLTENNLEIDCKDITRINSLGVKNWIHYFENLALKKIKFKFVNCSIAITEQMNLISNFSCGGSVESISVPFICNQCKNEFIGVFQTSDLIKSQFQLPKLSCLQCHKPLIFDDNPEEYFSFLKR